MRIRAVLGSLSVAAVALGLAAVPSGTAAAEPERPPFQLPVPCGDKILMSYGVRDAGPDQHAPALDIFRDPWDETAGNPVVAAADGVVTESYEDPDGGGNIIQIDHGGGWFTTSIHLQDRTVEAGDKIKQGELIGHIGKTGETSNDVYHLHFEQGYDENGDGFADWGAPDTERVVQVFDGVEYDPADTDDLTPLTSKNNCDGSDPDPEPEPEPEKTELKYTGKESIANGTGAELSATLTTAEGDEPVADQEVSFTLGSGEAEQTCSDTTNDDGVASCTVEEVDQPLTDEATVPLTVEYAGEAGAYLKAKTSEELLLQYFTGRAYGLAANVDVLGVPLPIAAIPDTDEVRTAGERAGEQVCVQTADAIVLSAGVLCADVAATTDPTAVTATATTEDVRVGLPGLPVLEISGVRSTSTSSCESAEGAVDLKLVVAGRPVDVGEVPNAEVDLGIAGTRLVVNEQVETDDGLTVNAAHLTAPGGVDVVIASSTSAAHNCG
ncbi:choice-of-anchor P family protein [Saccharopolyspora shandongensis]|uniref:choice-of-anchor P family protein n=1 Tax=Saccharopolyspora shandongensis TaxID=418495 RepID=UPI00340583D4